MVAINIMGWKVEKYRTVEKLLNSQISNSQNNNKDN